MLGSDPELFLKRGDKYVSAIGMIGGTKDKPKPVKELGKGYFVQEDNVLLEYNTPVAKSSSTWVQIHNKALNYFGEMLDKKGLKYSIDASADMPEEELLHPRALVFGCEPDFNVWTLQPNPRPHSENPRLRVAGGHVHVAFEGTNTEKVLFARKLDAFLGVWSVINDPDTRRRELYGKAGAIRFKPYGLEYRTLSNFWLKNDHTMAMVWDLVRAAMMMRKSPSKRVPEIINNNLVDEAMDYFRSVY